VSRSGDCWRFIVERFPTGSLRPAIAEFILPDDFRAPEFSLLEFQYRLLADSASEASASAEPHAPTTVAGTDKESLGVYWRTANGNLYTTGQSLWAVPTWQRYAQMRESFTMAFYGRANLPWRFTANQPVSLVLTFKPNYLPAIYEIRGAAIAAYSLTESRSSLLR
jgi:hypothetical protein